MGAVREAYGAALCGKRFNTAWGRGRHACRCVRCGWGQREPRGPECLAGHPGSEVRSTGGLGAGSASVLGNTHRRTLLSASKKERAQIHEEATTVLHGGSELELG